MELRLTLLDQQHAGARVDVLIDTPAGTPFCAVSDQLAAALEITVAPKHHFSCAGKPVDGSQPLGFPPLLQGAVLTLATGPLKAASDRPRPLLAAHVIAGPDAGIVVPLTLGRHSIGRGTAQLIRLTDPEASRVHAELTVAATQIELRDVGSANGTWLADRRLGPALEALHPEQQIRIGTDLICLRRPDRPPAAGTLDGAGHLKINRAPQLHPPRAAVEISYPAQPSDRPTARMPWLAMLLPLLLAVPLALFWKQPTFLLFALLTPVLMLGQHLTDRRTGRRESARRQAEYQTAQTRRHRDLERAVAVDVRHLEAARPDLARLAVTAEVPTDELWRRSGQDADFLTLRLGRGPETSQITVHRPDSETNSERTNLEAERFVHADVPVAVNLATIGILGICGPRRSALGLVRSLIGQICVLHSPQEVGIHVLTDDPEHRRDWNWVAWLPHRTAGAEPDERGRRVLVLVLDGAHRLRGRQELAAAFNRAPAFHQVGLSDRDAGRHRRPLILCLDRGERDLPIECGALVSLDAAANPAILRRTGMAASHFVPDLASAFWAERLARDLAPLRDATPEPGQGLPHAVRLIDLLTDSEHVRPTDPDDLARYWRRAGGRPSATLGVSASGPFRIDLRQHGPHVLIGGTTGSGKSELLQTLIAALAVGSGPDAVSFLLVDYKGGAAFGECAELPHVGGLITDLDPLLARRALASLTAELRRRERLLRSISAPDIDGYRVARTARPNLPVLPRLVVIVDEFRVLAEELPEFVSGLVRTATIGRSLGVHLVLATQRPSGIVSAEITSNVNLRIALRVNDGGDSQDLIDDPAAASLPSACPGRALARSGADPLISFQTAVVSGRSRDTAGQPTRIRRLDPDPGSGDGSTHRREFARPIPVPDSPSDLTLIAHAARAASEQLGLPSVQPPWVAPLPQHVDLGQLLAAAPSSGPTEPGYRQALQLPFALLDLPAEQRHEVLAWQLDGTHLAIGGGPRSGRTTTLRSLARAASVVSGPDVHVYALDGAGGLASLQSLPGVEAVIPVHDTERGERLLRLLRSEVAARQGEQPAHLLDQPTLVLLIDGWEALTNGWGVVDHGRPIDQLLTLLRDGPAVGLHAVISGGRALLTGAVCALLTERVLLRFADPTDAVLAGVPSSQVLGSAPAGRGLVLGPRFPEPVEIQVAMGAPLDSPQGDGVDGAFRPGRRVSRPDRTSRPPATRRSWRIPELPRRLEHSRLLEIWRTQATANGSRIDPDRRQVPVGIGGDEALPLCLDLDAAPVTLIAGPAGSGRTSALRCIADGLGRLGESVLWVSLTGRADHSVRQLVEREPFMNSIRLPDPALNPGPDLNHDLNHDSDLGLASHLSLADLPGFQSFQIIDGSRPGAVAMLGGALAAWPTSTVLVDDIQSGMPGSAQDALEDLLLARVGTSPLVITSSPAELLGAYRGLLAAAKATRSGLLLGPAGPGEAEAFGLRSERRPPGPPGRALLIQAGRAVSVQLSLPPHLEHTLPAPDGRTATGVHGETGTPGAVGNAVVAGRRGSPPRGDPTATGRSGEMVDT